MKTHTKLIWLFFIIASSIQTTSATELYIQGKVYAKKESGQLVPQYFEEEKDKKKAIVMKVSITEANLSEPTKRHGKYRIFVGELFKPGDRITLNVIKPGWKVTQPTNGSFIIPSNPKAQTDIILEQMNTKPKNTKHIYTVQTLNTRDENKAETLKRALINDYRNDPRVYIEKYMVNNMPNNGYEYKVKIGEFPEKTLAEQLRYGLSKRYKKFEDAFITLKDHK